ncbi:PRC-barrel domain-containing protein [Methylorubrum rhodesianum]|uniref:PRC-barrel domain-containing protein n=1 Tax=Methylorubrum rhodesianum TaxID=29427 RepID=UPI003D015575
MSKRTLIAACALAALTGYAVAQGTSGGAGSGGSTTGGSGTGAAGSGTASGSGNQGGTSAQTVPGWGGTQGQGSQGQGSQGGQAGTGQATTQPGQGGAPAGQGAAGNATQGTQAGPGGLITINPRAVLVTYYTAQPADTLASKLMRTTVYNNDGQKLGQVEDLLISQGQTISGVVIGIGGFLGLGERYISLPPSSIVLTPDGDRSYRAVINTSREDLNKAPEFKFEGAQSR